MRSVFISLFIQNMPLETSKEIAARWIARVYVLEKHGDNLEGTFDAAACRLLYGKEFFQVNITFKIASGVGVLAVSLLAYKVFDHFRVMNVRSCPSSCIANLKQIDGA